jgi:glycosyltransferase involved in cell wall biosynthesis
LLLELRSIEKKRIFVKTSNIAKVSVFLPIYNKEKFLFRSINSIQSQSLKNIEIIAVNDGSTDNSLKILRKLSKKDKRIKLINNDRNHGLLYSRAMGIINSSGEYLLNLDPDDKLESNSDLKILYNKAKKSKLDYILYLLKRVPRFKSEIKDCKLRNQLQLQSEDFLITNKFIKRKILLKAYKFFKSDIYKFKWDYHEDNIWNILTRVYGQTNKIVNKYIYIYKRNNDSLNVNKSYSIEMKNRIYRIKALFKVIENNNINNSNLYYEKNYQDYIYIYRKYNKSLLKFTEIKNNLINISFSFLKIYRDRKNETNKIFYIMNSFSNNKIIFFYSSINNNIIDYLTYLTIYKYLQKNNVRKIISVNINDKKMFKIILNYIFPNDILFGLGNLIFNSEFTKIINKYNKNKVILLYYNIHKYITNNHIYKASSYLFMHSFNRESILRKNNKLYCIPNNIIYLANYYNYKRNINDKKNNIIVFFDNYTCKSVERINNIIGQKLVENETIFNLTEIFLKITNITNIIRESRLIITDNFTIMELSALYFTSCILYGNSTDNNNINARIAFNLKYIKYIDDINKLEELINDLENKSNEFNEAEIKMDYKNLLLEFKI